MPTLCWHPAAYPNEPGGDALVDLRNVLKTRYSNSRALVIGINEYQNTNPLGYAVNDAREVRRALIEVLNFPEQNVTCLLDHEATRDAILRNYHHLAKDDVDVDERIIVFFAGHGDTVAGYRGDVGYLVPYDAVPGDLSSLIPWSALTRGSEVIRAKHMLFIMDACYGGLALNRSLHPGSARFLKDMLLRFSRQVLTAGKANEVVADAGGPIPGHSVFTGHLLEGLRGKAVNDSGILTAAGLMSYVYGKVASDRNSNQTPHYGHFDGDGDIILLAPTVIGDNAEEDRDMDSLLIVPHSDERSSPLDSDEKVSRVKSLLAAESSAIQLHDFVVTEIRGYLAANDLANFSMHADVAPSEIVARVKHYEKAVTDLALSTACIAYWGKPTHRSLMEKVFARSADQIEMASGHTPLLALRYYPLLLKTYYAGVAAVENGRYDSLLTIFDSKLGHTVNSRYSTSHLDMLINGVLELNRSNAFLLYPGLEKKRVPISEHLYKVLQPKLDDILFIGRNYDKSFDEFEVLLALAAIDGKLTRGEHGWGPLGRYAWKAYGGSDNPLERTIADEKRQGSSWPPLLAGLFGGAPERFEAAAKVLSDVVSGLHWH